MTSEDKEFINRVEKMVERAAGIRPLADQLGVTDSAVRSWLAGSKPFDSTLRKVHAKSRISPMWIRDGAGEDDIELAKIGPLPPRGSRSDIARDILQEDSIAFSAHAADDDEPVRVSPRHALGMLKLAMEEKGMNAKALAKAIGYEIGPVQAVLERGSRLSEAMAEKIVKVLPDLDIDTLLGGSDTPRIIDPSGATGTFGAKANILVPAGMSVKMLPLLSWTKAGMMTNFEDECYTGEAVPAFNVSDPKAFALKVRGDSMEPRVKEGDIVIVCPSWKARNGDTVIVRTVHGDIMCKLYQTKFSGKFAVLSSYNPAYPPVELSEEEIEWIYPVQGVMQTLRKE